MNGFATSLAELKKKKGVFIALVVALLIPLIYAAIILTPSWGPYDNLSNLPVAVVNEDKGAMSGENPINIGEDLIATLKESKTLGWEFVSATEAKKGMDNLKYYMVVEIPEDFSEKATTVLTSSPTIPQLKYTQNEGLHFMAAQVTKSATEKIREQLGNKVTETYAKSLFTQLAQVAEGFQDGADGSTKIHDGSVKLKGGTGQILESLDSKSGDIAKLANGAKQLKDGTGTLLSSVKGGTGDINKLAAGSKELAVGSKELSTGTKTLANGTKTLANGTKELAAGGKTLATGAESFATGAKAYATGAKTFSTGATTLATSVNALSAGAKDLPAGANQILAGLKTVQNGSGSLSQALDQLSPGSKQVADGVGAVNKGAGELAAGSSQVTAGLEQLIQHPVLGPVLANSPDFQKLLKGSKDVTAGLTNLQTQSKTLKIGADSVAGGLAQASPGAKSIQSGLKDLVAGQTKLAQGATQLATAASPLTEAAAKLTAGANDLANNTGKLDNGATQLDNGASSFGAGVKQVSAGADQLVAGVNKLDAGTSRLAAGAGQLANGNASLTSSWRTLTNGIQKINNGATQVSDGNQTVKTGWSTLTDGVKQVDVGIGQIESGSNELANGLKGGAEKTSSLKVNDENITMFASPVELNENVINKYPMYRYANAPYILSLALFVGILVLSLLFDIRKPADIAVSGFKWYSSIFSKMAGLATIQAFIMSIFALFFIRVSFSGGLLLVLFSILASITFLTIVFFLVAVGGNIGRFIAVSFLVLQLSTTGSSLPIEMLPEKLRALSNFLPLRYSIDSFRGLISLDNTTSAWENISILLIYLVVFSVLISLVAMLHSKKSTNQTSIEA